MCKIYQANMSEDRQRVRELFTELLQFIHDNIYQRFGVGFDIQAKTDEWITHVQEFFPPNGCLYIVAVDSEVVGMGCLRTIGERLGEIKHFYIRPQYRCRGLGRKLMEKLIEQSKSMGYTMLCLDTGWFMEAAQALYCALGFKEVSPYPESEVPKELHPFWVFMQKDLVGQT